MAGVREDEFTGGTDPHAARGCEAKLSLRYQGIIEVEQDLGRIIGRLTTQHAEYHGYPHGGGQSLARYISNDCEKRPIWSRLDEEEVTANFACRQVNRVHMKARRRTRGALEQHLLH